MRSRPHRLGFPCSGRSPCHACRRHYPGGTAWTLSLVLSSQRRPSPLSDRVGSHIILFEACSAFTRVTACLRAESPTRPFDIGVLRRDSLPPLTAPTASGWSDPLPGGTLTHWRPPSLHGAPDRPHERPICHNPHTHTFPPLRPATRKSRTEPARCRGAPRRSGTVSNQTPWVSNELPGSSVTVGCNGGGCPRRASVTGSAGWATP